MAKSIMIQGTMSNAGKSLITAGLCRIFRQDGYRTAPFKSQNMALNSFITKDGLEMGRAQVVQAEAAGIEPSVLMNPILLKPTNDTKSQVILRGEVLADMNAAEYYRNKRRFVPEIEEAFELLSSQYDIIVMEGAGSPVEINLKENDIVNMFMAKLAKAPVLLAGDIDRGGVFASLVGTMELFEPDERDLVKGVLINKFRGDREILRPGLEMLEDLIHKPVLGVIPYLNVDIEDEDSLTTRFSGKESCCGPDIAVIRLPRISNFTDFNALSKLAGVNVRYAARASELGEPAMVILPGTKNTMEDLLWMRQNGLEASILKLASRGTVIFGVCGGYQMLGTRLSDPDNVEHGGELQGMGLLPMRTVFAPQKTRTRAAGGFGELQGALKSLSGMPLTGYEIHMGITEKDENTEDAAETVSLCRIWDEVQRTEAKPDGGNLGNVYGAYVHGIFDGEGIAGEIARALYAAKGMDYNEAELSGAASFKDYKEMQYDALAAGIRESVNMDRIYEILEGGV